MSEYPQVVYFIQQGDGGPIKIGTTILPFLEGRLKQIQTGSPHPLRLLGVIEGGYDLERRLHGRFIAYRLEGEWFRAEPDLIQFVSASVRQRSEVQDRALTQAGSTAARDERPAEADAVPRPRSLSALESKLILQLASEKKMVITIVDVMTILDCSYDHARQVVHRLVQRRWLAPLAAGKYEFIPAERGEHAFVDTNPFFIGSVLVEPYHFSFATAAFFHGLSTQASATVYLATSVRTGRRLYHVRGKDYRLVFQPAGKFFGAVEVDAYGSRVSMAEPEKTVVDALDRPEYAGDIPEIGGMLWHGQGRLNWDKLAQYGLRFESQALVQRLGYLVDLLRLPVPRQTRELLLTNVGQSTPYLGRRGRWGTGGAYDPTWRLVDNVPRQTLLAEIEVR